MVSLISLQPAKHRYYLQPRAIIWYRNGIIMPIFFIKKDLSLHILVVAAKWSSNAEIQHHQKRSYASFQNLKYYKLAKLEVYGSNCIAKKVNSGFALDAWDYSYCFTSLPFFKRPQWSFFTSSKFTFRNCVLPSEFSKIAFPSYWSTFIL
jgi:hypothetical protein